MLPFSFEIFGNFHTDLFPIDCDIFDAKSIRFSLIYLVA